MSPAPESFNKLWTPVVILSCFIILYHISMAFRHWTWIEYSIEQQDFMHD